MGLSSLVDSVTLRGALALLLVFAPFKDMFYFKTKALFLNTAISMKSERKNEKYVGDSLTIKSAVYDTPLTVFSLIRHVHFVLTLNS